MSEKEKGKTKGMTGIQKKRNEKEERVIHHPTKESER